MKTLYPLRVLLLTCLALWIQTGAQAQACADLRVQAVTRESRCMATGAITVTASGGSGSYNYRVSGPVNSSLTSSNDITGLSPGTYTVTVVDIISGCQRNLAGLVVAGSYLDPRFSLAKTDETCILAQDGTIRATGINGGRAPYSYQIIAPSPYGVGTSTASGVFTGLPGGEYAIQLRDSCGGIQTRRVSVLAYDWWIDAYSGLRNNCRNADFSFSLRDNLGQTTSNSDAFDGFQYGVSRRPGDTAWFTQASFTIDIGTNRSLRLVVKDGCGNVKRVTWQVNPKPGLAGAVATTVLSCNRFSATITGQTGLTNPVYRLFTTSGTLLQTNGTGQFTGFAAGRYYIEVRDDCYDTTMRRDFSVTQPVPGLPASVNLTQVSCNQFRATVGTGSQWTSPVYRLYDAAHQLIATNSSGVFNGLTRGNYCTSVQDGCYDTTISRCFTVTAAVPSIAQTVSISNAACSTASISVGSQQNLTNPRFCLYNAAGDLIGCNGNGNFGGLPFGNYCLRMTNDPACYDTTIQRCFVINRPLPSVNASLSVSRSCSTLSLSVGGQQNLNTPQFCLYDASNNLVSCNATGNFNNLPYGRYCMEIRNNPLCYDTVIRRCVTVSRNIPSAGAVTITRQNCADFSARISSASNLSNPVYQVYQDGGALVASNSSGTFTGLAYGSYTLRIVNNAACYDTVIVRSFSASPQAINPTVTAQSACIPGGTDMVVTIPSGQAPYSVRVYNPQGQAVGLANSPVSPITIADLPAIPSGLSYRVVVTDQCGATATRSIEAQPHLFSKYYQLRSKCPSGTHLNGSSSLEVQVSSSRGGVYPELISKDGQPLSMGYNLQSGTSFTWNDLGPGTYIVRYALPSGCASSQYDTVSVGPYRYPELGRSAAYQCDNNQFSVGASVSGGASPFRYEIIGSQPMLPSITTAPQADPVFQVRNGQKYELVRLRAVDACGNATLNDVSILPLANLAVSSHAGCYYDQVMLSVDSLPNATYAWYRKTSPVDSVLLGDGRSYQIPYLLPTDTGTYVARVSVNSGCLTQLTYFQLTPSCGSLLPLREVHLEGKIVDEAIELGWESLGDEDILGYTVERADAQGKFRTLGRVAGKRNGLDRNHYQFRDSLPRSGVNIYRLRMEDRSAQIQYSRTILLNRELSFPLRVFPNPVPSPWQFQLELPRATDIQVQLLDPAGKQLFQAQFRNTRNERISLNRSQAGPGYHLLRVTDLRTGIVRIEKLLLR